jgi:hypothetical protein
MSVLFNISVGLPVLKALTAQLEEGQTYDDLLQQLLGLDSIVEPEVNELHPRNALAAVDEEMKRLLHERSGKEGFFSRGLWLPNGTELRARYKHQEYRARIASNTWIDADGSRHTSPSAAATAITDTNVNGLRFWEARRPGDTSWRRLDQLVQP